MSGEDSNQQQHQQWMAMQQYQQQWMAMQHYQQMYHQHYAPYYHQQFLQQQQRLAPSGQIQAAAEDNNTIWIGDLQEWMDENYLHSCFSQMGEVASVKVIRNKQTGQSERYGFIEFSSHAAAENALQSYNGSPMPNSDQLFRLNWASFSTGDKCSDGDADLAVFVGDLASDVTDELLQETFASRYPSVRSAKVVVDGTNGRSKGYGFVRFNDENERDCAMSEMNGVYCSNRPMRVSAAAPRRSSAHQQYSSQAVILAGGYPNGGAPQGQPDTDSSNTTIFVGGLDSDATDEDLRQCFGSFGPIISIKIPVGKGCGFVQFASRSSAEDALQGLNGVIIGKQAVRLSWGRNMGNRKQFRGEGNNHWDGGYYGRHGYNAHGYTAASNGHANYDHTLS